MSKPCLRLGAVCIWILNAISSRPGDYSWHTALVETSAAYEIAEEADEPNDAHDMDQLIQDGDLVPMLATRGCYFVSAILCVRGVYQMPAVRELSNQQYAKIYYVDSLAGLRHTIMNAYDKALRKARLPRRTRARPTAILHDPAQDIDVGLDEAGVRLGEPMNAVGPDIAPGEEPAEDPEDALNHVVNVILQSLYRDIIQVCPAGRSGQPDHCTLGGAERLEVTQALFRGTRLPFRQVFLKPASTANWDGLFFDRFFPTHAMWDEMRRKKQRAHFGACRYYHEWLTLLARLREGTGDEERVRAVLRREFNKLVWLPWTASDKLWVTKSTQTGHYQKLPEQFEGAGLHIAVNMRSNVALDAFELV